MDEVYCPTAARNEVLILLSWLTVVLVLFSRKRLDRPPAEPPKSTEKPTAEPEPAPKGPAGANLSPGASQVRSRAGEAVKSAGWI